jgi:hypothetical protein
MIGRCDVCGEGEAFGPSPLYLYYFDLEPHTELCFECTESLRRTLKRARELSIEARVEILRSAQQG